MKESTIRIIGVVGIVCLAVFSETAREYALIACIVGALIYVATILAACVLIPEEVAKWLKETGKWPHD